MELNSAKCFGLAIQHCTDICIHECWAAAAAAAENALTKAHNCAIHSKLFKWQSIYTNEWRDKQRPVWKWFGRAIGRLFGKRMTEFWLLHRYFFRRENQTELIDDYDFDDVDDDDDDELYKIRKKSIHKYCMHTHTLEPKETKRFLGFCTSSHLWAFINAQLFN